MSTILFIATLVLNLAGIVFSAVYIWLNVFSHITDLAERNRGILKITRASMYLSLVFALLSCLLSDNAVIAEAIKSTGTLYTVIAISWLAVLFLCGVAMLFSFLSKSTFKRDLMATVKKIFTVSLTGSIIAVVLTWVFS